MSNWGIIQSDFDKLVLAILITSFRSKIVCVALPSLLNILIRACLSAFV